MYRGPAGEVPPESRNPSDPPPPPEGGPDTTPGGETGGPTTGGGDIGGPTTGSGDNGGGPTTGDGGSGPSVGSGAAGGPKTSNGPARRTAAKGPGYDDWTYWWTFNKDEILRLKGKLDGIRADTGMTAHAFGGRKSVGVRRTATVAAIENEITPRLLAMLESDDTHFDMRSASAIALAKIGETSIVPLLGEMARNDDGKYHRIVEESAALALGLLQSDSEQVREILVELVLDKDRNASFVRPFAAISLGLLDSDVESSSMKMEALLQVVAGKESKPDVKPAALLGIGLLGDERAVPDLLHMLQNGRAKDGKDDLSDVELSFVVQALGKIACPGTEDNASAVTDTMLELLSKRSGKKTPVHVRRSTVIALGQLAPACEASDRTAIIKALKSAASGAKDKSERAFALIALGRMAADVDADTRADLGRTLRHHLDDAKPANVLQPFAGIALALAGGKKANDEDFRKPLRDEFAKTARGDARARSAYAIASGLVDDPFAVDSLTTAVQDRGADKRLRAYSSVALGMIGSTESVEVIRDVLNDDSDRDLRTQAAVAAGLLGDAQAVGDLVAILERGKDSQYVLGSVALALGQIGDERAIEPLVRIAEDTEKRYPDITRALATVALGQIGDRREVPVLARVARDINFRTIGAVPALTELLTIL
jgi:HEAT repeat protein